MSEIDKCTVELAKLKRSFWWNIVVSICNLTALIIFVIYAVKGWRLDWYDAVLAVFNGIFSGIFARAAYDDFLKKLDVDIKRYKLKQEEREGKNHV